MMIMFYTRSRSALSVRDKVACAGSRCSDERIKDEVEEVLVVEGMRIIPKVLRLGRYTESESFSL